MKFVIYALEDCPYSIRAADFISKHPVLKADVHWAKQAEKEQYKRRNKMNTFPQVFFKYKPSHGKRDRMVMVGGYSELMDLAGVAETLIESKVPLAPLIYLTRMLQKER
jgi:glutaredoxin